MKKIMIIFLVSLFMLSSALPTLAQTEDNQGFRNVTAAEPKVHYLIQGEARIWEASFQYRIKADGQIIKEGMETASHGAPKWGKFSFDVIFDKNQVQGKELTLELFEISAKDGSEIHKLIIPLHDVDGNHYQNKAFRKVTAKTLYRYQVQGEARVFEGTYHYEVSDGHNILTNGFGTTSAGAPNWGTFTQSIVIPKEDVPINGSLVLELYGPNMSDEGPPRLFSYFLRLDQFPW